MTTSGWAGALVAPGFVAALVALAVLVLPVGRGRSEQQPATRPGLAPPLGGRVRPVGLSVDDVATTMVLLGVALRSGCGLVEAVEAVARVSGGRVAADLRSVAAAQRWGVAVESAWTTVDPGWAHVARVLAVAARAGLAPSGMLVERARDLRADELAALDVLGARVAVRLVLPLGAAFLPAFALTTVVPLVIALSARVFG